MNNVLQTNDVVILLTQIVSSLNKQQVLQAHYCQKRVLLTNFLNVKIVIFWKMSPELLTSFKQQANTTSYLSYLAEH